MKHSFINVKMYLANVDSFTLYYLCKEHNIYCKKHKRTPTYTPQTLEYTDHFNNEKGKVFIVFVKGKCVTQN